MSGRVHGDRGFTLLEVMVSLAIIAGVVFTVIGAVNYHLAIVSRDREESVAQLLARQKLEELEREPSMPETKNGTFAPAWPAYSWQMAVLPTQLPGLKKITLTVSWEGEKRRLSLVHYVAKQ